MREERSELMHKGIWMIVVIVCAAVLEFTTHISELKRTMTHSIFLIEMLHEPKLAP